MRIDDVLTHALREEADALDVDVTRMWVETRARLDEQARPSRNRRTLVAVAAAAAVLVGGATLVGLDRLGDDTQSPAGPTEGDVDETFSCPDQVVHDWTRPGSVIDDYFVASLRGGLGGQAKAYDVPMYELDVDGDRAVASFGNADGSLALRSEFRREGEEWVAVRSEVCRGEGGSAAVPVDDPLQLGPHGGEALPAPDTPWQDPLLLDHRSYYDHVGVVRGRSLFVVRAGSDLRLVSVMDDGTRSSRLLEPTRKPVDVSALLLPGVDPRLETQPYGLWVLYDPADEVAMLTATRGNLLVSNDKVTSDDWAGTLHLVMAPFDEVTGLTVVPPEKVSRGYSPEELPGYRAYRHRG